ncbi:MAG TPA: outer membrane beta-barrel protein [Rhizomicrobium sp.]|nr:outer membrane beta-barrel protein [Rhizomicrobium sp.]
MNNRKFILGGIALFTASQAQAAVPALDTPPVTVQFSTTYYSNIAGSSGVFALARGLQKDDVLYAPAVLTNLVEPMGSLSLFLAGQAGYDIHQNNSVLDRERIDLQAGADTYLAVCDTTLTGTWGRHQSDLMDLSVGTLGNTQQTISAGLGVSCDRMGRLVPSAGIKESWADNSATQYFRQDFHNFSANVGLGYNFEPIGLVSVFGEYEKTRYPHRIFAVAGGGPITDGYTLYTGGLRYSRIFAEQIQVAAQVAETSSSSDGGIGQNFSGVTYGLNLGYTPGARWSFNLDFDRTANPSYYLNASFALAEHYSGSVNYRFTSRLMATLGASDTHTKFTGAALIPGTNITDQTYWSYYGSVAFNVSPTFSVTLNAGEDQRHADVVGYSYSGGHVGLALSKAF